jgi:hypothetical protein
MSNHSGGSDFNDSKVVFDCTVDAFDPPNRINRLVVGSKIAPEWLSA